MRAFLITLFLAVLSTSFAIKITTEQRAFNANNLEFADNKLGDAIKSLIQVSEVHEYVEVFDILTKVRGELAALLTDTQAIYDSARTAYEEQKGTYEESLKTTNARLTEVRGLLSDAEAEKVRLDALIESSLNAVREATDAIEKENTRRQNYYAAYVQKVDDLTDAIAACNDAIAILHEIDEKDLNAVLLQTSTKSLKVQFDAIHSKLSNMKLKSTVLPLVKTLVEIAAQGVNADMIARLIQLIEELRDSLQAEITNANSEEEADSQYHDTALATYQSTIDSESKSANDNNEILTQVKADIENYTNEIKDLERQITETQGNLDGLNAEWATRSGNYDGQLDRLRKDIAAIDAALTYLSSEMEQA